LHPHGHNYEVSVTVRDELTDEGWVVDKGAGTSIVDRWNHRFLLEEGDPFVEAFERSDASVDSSDDCTDVVGVAVDAVDSVVSVSDASDPSSPRPVQPASSPPLRPLTRTSETQHLIRRLNSFSRGYNS
jgi:6-pyruvoyl-tetrahydropterin synthase